VHASTGNVARHLTRYCTCCGNVTVIWIGCRMPPAGATQRNGGLLATVET
jgi:hypothetical protein